MSLTDYRASIILEEEPFYALVMAVMRKADNVNLEKMKAAFPDTWNELQKRYNAPAGCLTGKEREWLDNVLNCEQDALDDEDDECEEEEW